jgi:hypothetical protein
MTPQLGFSELRQLTSRTNISVGKPEEKRPLGRPRRRWEDIFIWIFRKWDGEAWTGLIWLRIRAGGGLLYAR